MINFPTITNISDLDFLRNEPEFGDIQQYNHDIELEDTIIVDIDGTIASRGGRSPFEWSKVGGDSIIKDELYEAFIRGVNNISAVFEDRLQMIRHWTLKDVPDIINVGKYNEEF